MGSLIDFTVFANQVSENIGSAFREIALFIKQLQLLWLNVYFVLIILLFFAMIALIVWLPVRAKPYYIQIKKMFFDFFEKLETNKLNKDE